MYTMPLMCMWPYRVYIDRPWLSRNVQAKEISFFLEGPLVKQMCSFFFFLNLHQVVVCIYELRCWNIHIIQGGGKHFLVHSFSLLNKHLSN